jgi:agmatinase
MASIFDESVFAPVHTFMGAPQSWDLADAKAAVLGIPFDAGTHPVRIGARLGPSAIREQSTLVRRYEPPLHNFDPVRNLGLVDCGNVRVTPGVIGDSFAAIEEAVWRIARSGAVPFAMGGDGMISLPQMRALHRVYPDLCVLHLDAHTDAYPNDGPTERDRYNPGTTFTCAAEESLVDTGHSLHVGARGPTYEKRALDAAMQRQYGVIPGVELRSRGIPDVLREIRERMAGRPVYLCFDMDFFDPSCAPGVCTPAWGGLSAGEGLALIAALDGLQFVAFDINTVSPPHDVGGMTAFLAASCLHQFLILLCKQLRLTQP